MLGEELLRSRLGEEEGQIGGDVGGLLKEELGGGAEEIGFVAGCCGRRFVAVDGLAPGLVR